MKQISSLCIFISLFQFSIAQHMNKTSAAFTNGNIVVYRVGDGSAALTSAATAVFLDEYTTTGVLVQSIPLPTVASGLNKAITASGSATSDGLMTRSVNGKYLLVTGYDATIGTASITGTSSTANNRVVGVVDASGNIDASTALTDAFSANNIRGACSTNGIDIWVSGSGNGIKYLTKGSTTSTQLATTPTTIRSVAIFNGQLFCSSSTTSFYGVSSLSSGLPSTAGQTISLLPGFPTTTGPSSYAFNIKPNSADVMYVADDRTIALGGGVQKWVLSSGTWTLAYTLNTGLAVGARSIEVDWSGANPIIYTVSTDFKINKTTDVGAASTFTTIVSAATNTAFRGIAFAPNNILPLQITSFNVLMSNRNIIANWKTINEINVSVFEIERSTNGINFVKLGTINANNQTNNTYSFVDDNPTVGKTFYRLKVLDKDGTYTYSNMLAVNFEKKQLLTCFPNPANDLISLSFPKSSENANVIISDMQGKVILSKKIVESSIADLINVSNLNKGTYTVTFNDINYRSSVHFSKL